MCLRRTHGILGLGVACAAMLFGLVSVAPARAAPHQSASPAAARESNKKVLADTSIDGPAFWSMPGVDGIVAWTGTDTSHRINTMRFRSVSGGYVFDNKNILDETSIARPAVTVDTSQGHDPYYFVAWTGTNTTHSLNIICTGCATSQIKLTLRNESSIAGPALALLDNKLMLAWTGADLNHSLNVIALTVTNGAFVEGAKATFLDFSSMAGPGLTYDPNQKGLLLSWSDRSSERVKAAFSATGADFPSAGRFTYSEFSAAPPNTLAILPTVDVAHTYLAWTGIDPGHSLNLLYPAYPAQTNATKVTLMETALGGPALGYLGGARLAIMWTGTDSLHHLNFATLDF